jgi:hypothetical protein
MSEVCRKCGTPLQSRAGAGRPAEYCSPGCRRSAEHEIRRVSKSITDLEAISRVHRAILAAKGGLYPASCCRDAGAHEAFVVTELALLEERLRLLLDASESLS